jgi:hypothetical protein
MRATMPMKMIRLVPLPTPRAVICSPRYMTNIVPVVKVSTVSSVKAILPPPERKNSTTMAPPSRVVTDNRKMETPMACSAAIPTVR